MLELHLANRFDLLADDLAVRTHAQARAAGVLAPIEVIVPSAAIARALTLRLARTHGVCANVRFSYLARWLWEQIARVLPGVAAQSPFESDVLAWRIGQAFDDADWVARQPRLGSWLAQADPVMKHELATQVARLFDQYLTYRPEWMEGWARGELACASVASPRSATWCEEERWQAALWQRLSDAILGAEARARTHPVRALARALQGDAGGAVPLPAAAHLVALPSIPPLYLEALVQLGRRMSLHLYALDPCREYWFDVVDRRRLAWLATRGQVDHHEVGNRLLASWGRQAKASLSQLVEATGEGMVDDARFEASASGTLLARWQDAVLDLNELAPGSVALAEGDRSLEVHVCHSLTRELEVLHDRLLGLFVDDAARQAAGSTRPALQPADILVVTPDLEASAPLIEAVFATVAATRRLPFAITGRARARANAPARALLDLLALAASRFAVNDVLAFLQQAVVARRFDLDDEDVAQIREWLLAVGVHWALDAPHRAGFDLPGEEDHSFAAGLERLFLAYAMPDQATMPFDGRLPAGRVEGSGAATLGVLAHIVQTLSAWQARLARAWPATRWPALLAEALVAFVAADPTQVDDLREVQVALEKLASDLERADVHGNLAPDVVRHALEAALEGDAPGGVPTGAITFASMASLRGLPYRVVCVVGLDDGAWPTTRRAPEFDLMAASPRPGDRQRGQDERNVFLDLMLAAQDVVHLSCTGRSVRDNAPLPPSVLIDEWLDVLVPAIDERPEDRAQEKKVRDRLVVEHPLQAFSESAFDLQADQRLRSFDGDYADALRRRGARSRESLATTVALTLDTDEEEAVEPATRFIVDDLPEPSAEWRDIPLERLLDFFRNPCRFLVRERLGVELRRDEPDLDDDEPWESTAWPGSPWVKRVLPALLAGASVDEARTMATALPDMPTGGFARRALDAQLASMNHFAQQVRKLEGDPPSPPLAVEIELQIDGHAWTVRGTLDALRPQGNVHWRYAERKPVDLIDAWLSHLLLCIAAPPDVPCVTNVVSRDRNWRLGSCAAPREQLASLVRLYAEGLRRPLPFFPKASWTLADGGTLAAARTEFQPSANPQSLGRSESEDAGVRLAWRGRPDPFDSEVSGEFERCARAVFAPLKACLSDEGGSDDDGQGDGP